MLIKSLYDDNKFDVFLGNGWTNWVRVKLLPREVVLEGHSEHVDVTDKLRELIFFKIKKWQRT